MANQTGYALVIDQEDANRTFCQATLEQLGYIVRTAEHSEAALRFLRATTPVDLLVVNLQLLEHDAGVLAAVRDHSRPAVIVLTSRDSLRSAAHVPFTEAVLLAIPCSRDQLCAAVIVALRSQQASTHWQQAHELAQAEKIAGMGRLSASIAHEINNPLQALQSSLQLLVERQLADEKREQILSMANEQVGRLVGLVQHMMDLHRPPARDGLRPVSIHEVLESALLPLQGQLREHQIAIERDWDSTIPRVRGVSSQLKQVFSSLTLNAIDAMRDGGRLTLRTRHIERDGNSQVQITFADTGKGIAPEDLPHIFEPFYSTRESHTGLGLAVSYSIVEQHEGTLSAASDGEGAILRVVLPALH